MSEAKKPGDMVREARERFDLSQTAVAQMLGLSSGQSISNIERGVVTIPSVYVGPISAALGIDPAALIDSLVEDYRAFIESEVARGNQGRH